MLWTITLFTVFCTAGCVSSAAVVSRTDAAGTGRGDLAALAASLSIDLGKAPAWEPIPELDLKPIVTGEGLPTLQDLNLTWNDLLQPVPELHSGEQLEQHSPNRDSGVAERALAKRFDAVCYNTHFFSNLAPEPCRQYLWRLDTTPCEVPVGALVYFCTDRGVRYTGRSARGQFESSWCRHIVEGGNWILNNCQVVQGGMAVTGNGAVAAWGNGNLIVGIERHP